MARVDAPEPESRVVDNRDEERYELWLGRRLAGIIAYEFEPGRIVLIHTEVDPVFEGRGLAARLVTAALDDIRSRGLTLVPECPYVQSYLRRHSEYSDLLDRPSRTS
jgi:predicted GNAT family acetyltransferase